MADENHKQPPDGSRRTFLKYTGATIGGLVVGGVVGGAIARNWNQGSGAPSPTPSPGADPLPDNQSYGHALMFFNQQQFGMTEAAAERIFPKDELGPGAQELGVAFYIDHQLAGSWGHNAREYRNGPYVIGEATQGDYQSIKRNELFTFGLEALDRESESKYQKMFIDLTDEEKDDILATFETGDIIVIGSITGRTFFNLLRMLTIEGVYSDPLYGGNRNMDGWRMRGYPGNQMSYTAIMDQTEPQQIEPRSLHDHFVAH